MSSSDSFHQGSAAEAPPVSSPRPTDDPEQASELPRPFQSAEAYFNQVIIAGVPEPTDKAEHPWYPPWIAALSTAHLGSETKTCCPLVCPQKRLWRDTREEVEATTCDEDSGPNMDCDEDSEDTDTDEDGEEDTNVMSEFEDGIEVDVDADDTDAQEKGERNLVRPSSSPGNGHSPQADDEFDEQDDTPIGHKRRATRTSIPMRRVRQKPDFTDMASEVSEGMSRAPVRTSYASLRLRARTNQVTQTHAGWKKRTTKFKNRRRAQIPDAVVELRAFVDEEMKTQKGQRVILLLENKGITETKRTKSQDGEESAEAKRVRLQSAFVAALEQARSQASIAFGADEALEVVSVIVAPGGLWTYAEHKRKEMAPSPPVSLAKDPDWSENPRGSKQPPLKPVKKKYPFLQAAFGDNVYIELCNKQGLTQETQIAFAAIVAQLKERHADLWI